MPAFALIVHFSDIPSQLTWSSLTLQSSAQTPAFLRRPLTFSIWPLLCPNRICYFSCHYISCKLMWVAGLTSIHLLSSLGHVSTQQNPTQLSDGKCHFARVAKMLTSVTFGICCSHPWAVLWDCSYTVLGRVGDGDLLLKVSLHTAPWGAFCHSFVFLPCPVISLQTNLWSHLLLK